jgi:CRISPR-associated exonuclease Cas4
MPGAISLVPTFTDLARARYCPRQLYYARRDGDREPPSEATERRDLAFRYPELRTADDATLAALPIDLSPGAYRTALTALTDREDWDAIADPDARMVQLRGKDVTGVAHKLLAGDPPTPVIVSPGQPPERGTWDSQAVRAVAAAKALAWERERSVPRALVEYPASAAVRTVELTTRRKAAYRRTLRTVRRIDGPPPRLRSRHKCATCEYRERCGVRTRSLRSLLGL